MRILPISARLGLAVALCSHVGHGNSIFDPGNYNDEDVIRRDVAVIGGGASRTYGVIGLCDLGKSVVLVERASKLGGHQNTYQDPTTGVYVDYGVQAYVNNSVTRDFFARFDIPVITYEFNAGPTYIRGLQNGTDTFEFCARIELQLLWPAACHVSRAFLGLAVNACSRRFTPSVWGIRQEILCRERCIFHLFRSGRSGKSSFLRTAYDWFITIALCALLGGY